MPLCGCVPAEDKYKAKPGSHVSNSCILLRNVMYMCIMYIHVYGHMCVFKCVYVCVFVCVYVYMFMCVGMCVCVSAYTYT